VSAGGLAVSTTVDSTGFGPSAGGLVLSGGTASGTVVNSGGQEGVFSGGTDIGARINKGGGQFVFTGGLASGTIVNGGFEDVGFVSGVVSSAGGTTRNTQVHSGGVEDVFVGGVAANTTVGSGGLLVVESGGASSQTTITSGGTLELKGGGLVEGTAIIAAGGMLETTSGGTGIISGTVVNSGMLFASGSDSLFEIASGAIVSGGAAVVGNGIVDIQGASKENVRFVASGSGGLDLGDPTAYTGKVAGFGGSKHSNPNQFIDLTGVTFSSGMVTETYSGTTTSGVLTVTSSGTKVASIDLVGSYVTSDFHLTSGSGGSGTIITDPQGGHATIAGGSVLDINTPDQSKVTFAGPNATLVLDQAATFSGTVADLGALDHIDLTQIAFGARTTLGYTDNSTDTGGTLAISDGAHVASIALLGNYIAGSFVTAADGHGGTVVTEASQVEQQTTLTKPHG
jgi:autotransporter passenger strand-loop-strand repeat protein